MTAALAGCAPASSYSGGILLSVTSGSVSGGTELVVRGDALDLVTKVDFGGVPAASVVLSGDTLSIITPPAVDFQTGSVDVTFYSPDENSMTDEYAVVLDGFDYRVETPVDAQMSYLLAHFDEPNAQAFGRLAGTDCVNFTSQGLLARGWTMNGEWWHSQAMGINQYGRPWISSTAFMTYLAEHPELGYELEDDEVVVGDIAQFDYEDAGIRNHTATVSRVTGEGDSREIFVVQHNEDAAYKPVESLLEAHGPQAKVHYWHLVDPVG